MTPSNSIHFDTTDLPRVDADALSLAMSLAIEDGRGLMLMRGAGAGERQRLEAAFWQHFHGETREGVSALVRLWSLVDVFQCRRLQAMLLEQGFAILSKAIAVAADARLNIERGFNPQHFVMALAQPRKPARPAQRQVRTIEATRELSMAA
jgi:hypothetical protein